MQGFYDDMQCKSHVDIIISFVDIIVLHVDIAMPHVDKHKSHVNIIMLHVYIIYFACRGQKYATIQTTLHATKQKQKTKTPKFQLIRF